MTAIERMDAVLNVLSTKQELRMYSTDAEIHVVLYNTYPELRRNKYHASDLNKILKKLLNDGYVSRELVPRDSAHYSVTTEHVAKYAITFEGELFQQEGGYAAKLALSKLEEKRLADIEEEQKRNARAMTMLTALVAIFTFVQAVYNALEIIKFFKRSR